MNRPASHFGVNRLRESTFGVFMNRPNTCFHNLKVDLNRLHNSATHRLNCESSESSVNRVNRVNRLPLDVATLAVFISKRRYPCGFHQQTLLPLRFSSLTANVATLAVFISHPPSNISKRNPINIQTESNQIQSISKRNPINIQTESNQIQTESKRNPINIQTNIQSLKGGGWLWTCG